jgi:hypothetical protein
MTRGNHGRTLHRRLQAAILVAVCAGALGAGAAPAAAKTLSGELQCQAGDKVTGIWILGSKSGWHGFDYPASRLPWAGQYKVLNAVQGETMQAWLRCNVLGESYHRFDVGRGSTRHICATRPCFSMNLGSCGLQLVFNKPSIFKALGCFARNAR